jgi:hypothetical protein
MELLMLKKKKTEVLQKKAVNSEVSLIDYAETLTHLKRQITWSHNTVLYFYKHGVFHDS